jgi:hypothetical protein
MMGNMHKKWRFSVDENWNVHKKWRFSVDENVLLFVPIMAGPLNPPMLGDFELRETNRLNDSGSPRIGGWGARIEAEFSWDLEGEV